MDSAMAMGSTITMEMGSTMGMGAAIDVEFTMEIGSAMGGTMVQTFLSSVQKYPAPKGF